MRAMRCALLFGLLGAGVLARPARAAGLYLAGPGVGPLAQAGAVAASVTDPLALAYNPGGLSRAPTQLLVDGGLPLFYSSYRRRLEGSNTTLAPVRGRPLGLPIPALGLVWAPPSWGGVRLAALVASEYPALQRWPDPRREPEAPQRYATGGC